MTGVVTQNTEQIKELLLRVGLSSQSADKMAPFIGGMADSYAGLIIRGIKPDDAKEIYELAMLGYLSTHSSIQQEMEAIMKDESKLKAALEAITKAASDAMMESMKTTISSLKTEGPALAAASPSVSGSLTTAPADKKLH